MSDPIITFPGPNGTVYAATGDHVNCTLTYCPVEASVYGYRASLPLSALLIALYGLCMVAQIALGVKFRTWGYMIAMVLGCIDEIIGYAGRIMMWENPWDHNGFIIQIGMSQSSSNIHLSTNKPSVLITIGPVFFSAAIYVMLHQMYVSHPQSPTPNT